MKKTILIMASMVSLTAHSQDAENVSWKTINLFEFGMPITSCECNFENLLFNWSKWITNHEETKLLSYEYVEQLEDTARIAHYVNLMYGWESTLFSMSRRTTTSSDAAIVIEENLVPTTYTETFQDIPAEIAKDSIKMDIGRKGIEREIQGVRSGLMKEMQLGDNVFLLKFKSKEKTYDYYVVCHPKDSKLVSNYLSNINMSWSDLRDWYNSKFPK